MISGIRSLRWVVTGCATAAMLLVGAAPAAAAKLAEIASPGPGPAAYDKVTVNKFGDSSAKRVLVLMPGTIGGAGDFTLVAKHLVKKVPKLQVWALDRRSQELEDTDAFAAALRGELSLQEVFDYYLGWIAGATPPEHYAIVDSASLDFARDWGMETALNDARRVVKAASRKGRRVILGGHSLGASLAAAYAAWDFDGKPGYRELDGIVLIDGGLLGSFAHLELDEAQAQVAALEVGDPFADLLGVGIAEAAGLFGEIGGVFARLDPTGSAQMLQDFPLLPDEFDPGVPVTNRGLLGYAFDRETSPESLALLHVNAGSLAASGDPRDWEDGGVTPVSRLTRFLGQEPVNGVEWFFPKRLTIDTDGANEMRMTEVAEFLGLRLRHTEQIDVPIYAFQTDLTGGRVLQGAEKLVRKAETTQRESMLVDGAPRQSHLDPLTGAPKRNEFLKTVERFLAPGG